MEIKSECIIHVQKKRKFLDKTAQHISHVIYHSLNNTSHIKCFRSFVKTSWEIYWWFFANFKSKNTALLLIWKTIFCLSLCLLYKHSILFSYQTQQNSITNANNNWENFNFFNYWKMRVNTWNKIWLIFFKRQINSLMKTREKCRKSRWKQGEKKRSPEKKSPVFWITRIKKICWFL